MIVDRLHEVKKLIQNTIDNKNCTQKVRLIAVSKTKPVEDISVLYQEGVRDFGENKVQELIQKQAILPKDIKWHMIGHLQRNKVKYIAEFISFIHSVDSLRLAEEISKQAVIHKRTISILLEVNVAEEESKFGLSVEEVPEIYNEIKNLPGIEVVGLMTVAPYTSDSEENRPVFQKLRQVLVDIKSKNKDNMNMIELSMGMSGDYLVAIEEGATFVRVGTGIFGARNYSI